MKKQGLLVYCFAFSFLYGTIAETKSIRDLQPHNTAISKGKLNLSYMGLTSLDGLLEIPGIRDVVYLSFSGNYIEVLPENIFSGLTNLSELVLWRNNIEVLPENIFAGLDNLSMIDLRDNRIKIFPSNAVKHLKKLKELLIDDSLDRYKPIVWDFLAEKIPVLAPGVALDKFKVDFINSVWKVTYDLKEKLYTLGIPKADVLKIVWHMEGSRPVDISHIIGMLGHELGHVQKQHLRKKLNLKAQKKLDISRKHEMQADENVPSKLSVLRGMEDYLKTEKTRLKESESTHPLPSKRALRFRERYEKLDEGMKARREEIEIPAIDTTHGFEQFFASSKKELIPEIKGTSPKKAAEILGGQELADYYPSLSVYESVIIIMPDGSSVSLSPEFFELSPTVNTIVKAQDYNNRVSLSEIMPGNADQLQKDDLLQFNDAVQKLYSIGMVEGDEKRLQDTFIKDYDVQKLSMFADLNRGFQIAQLDHLLDFLQQEKD